MDNVLDGLGESNSLSPLSSNVHDHDEDFAGLGDHAGVSTVPYKVVFNVIK